MSERFPEQANGSCFTSSEVTQFLRGEIDAARRDAFRVHVLVCGSCAEEVESQQRVLDGLSQLVSDEPREKSDARSLAFSVIGEVDREERVAGGHAWQRRVAATVLLALGLGVAMFIAFRDPVDQPNIEESSVGGSTVAMVSDGVFDDQTTAAVARGLSWLTDVQEDHGGWSSARFGGRADFDIGVSARAVLALATSDDGEHLAAAARGADFLIGEQQRSGLFGSSFHGAIYNHSVGTRALLACWQRRDSIEGESARSWKESIDAAVSYLVRSQDRSGSWSSRGARTASESLSLSTWPLECLAEARALGWKNLDSSIRLATTWVDSTLRRGQVGEPSDVESLSWVVQRSEPGQSALARRTLDRLIAGESRYYSAFLVSRALRRGTEAWRKDRRRDAAQQLLARQESEGRYTGSWEPVERWSVLGGRLCSTALATLALDTRY